MQAILSGRIVVLEGGCLGLDAIPLQFPFGSELLSDGSGVEAPGLGVVRVGDEISGGGGY